jgi:predicted RNA-binding Zn ribbon-like protein
MAKRSGYVEREFDLSGGILCLDFANTVSRRKMPGRTSDNLPEYSDLVSFARQSRVVTPRNANELLASGRTEPRKAAAVLRAAILFREAIYRVFSSIAESRPVSPSDVKVIADSAGDALRHRQLVTAGRNYRWEWERGKKQELASVLWPIAQSAADLLTSDRLRKVRECDAPTCAWLFLDESRNHTRRWCDMTVCGNREKARRFYEREHT